MTEKIRSELIQIHEEACNLGHFAIGMLHDSINAFEKGDTKLAADVCDRKKELKRQFITAEESMFQYLALYQPVARDMREIVASIRIIYNFERIGRMGFDISETIKVLSQCCGLVDPEKLIMVARKVLTMIEDSMDAFSNREVAQIKTMRQRDSEIDRLYCEVMRDIIRRMEEEKESVPILARYVIINRYLERCGDQACNIAEMTTYMVTGERIEMI
ncbi:phosphate signaling complex protein PhoU [Methanospirillum stamsii]|uniref:Phosphate-specific transport system accessory protein PhoU n=1 Tax=Methanospirillum stamsii TaxID=1277351 RepID=A0A2V2NET7_9EURY|nr:phosphate signaling complex protein PhoU [Methanospirillum stamsii]PWR76086.1 phosphate transport system regulatory protein PhoU [Methanospirillum stamsii]